MSTNMLLLTLAIHWVSNKYPGSEIDWWLLAFWPLTLVCIAGNLVFLFVGEERLVRYRTVKLDIVFTIAVALVASVVLIL